jgi:hypothetical protein
MITDRFRVFRFSVLRFQVCRVIAFRFLQIPSVPSLRAGKFGYGVQVAWKSARLPTEEPDQQVAYSYLQGRFHCCRVGSQAEPLSAIPARILDTQRTTPRAAVVACCSRAVATPVIVSGGRVTKGLEERTVHHWRAPALVLCRSVCMRGSESTDVSSWMPSSRSPTYH